MYTGIKIFFLVFAFLAANDLCGQSTLLADTSLMHQSIPIDKLSDRAISKLDKKYGNLEGAVDKQSIKMLNRMEKQELRLQKKLMLKDSVAAKQLFADAGSRYEALKTKLRSPV